MSHAVTMEIRPYLRSLRYKARREGDTITFEKPSAVTDESGRTHVPKRWIREDLDDMRSQLLQVETLEQALAFGGRFGPLRKQGDEPLPAKLSDFTSLRDFVRKALLAPDEDHLDIGWKLSIEVQQGEPVFGFVECGSVVEAIKSTVFLDRMRGHRWQACEECNTLFEKIGGRARRYCSQKCGALQASRAYKARTRAVESRDS